MSLYVPLGIVFVHIPKTGGSAVVEWLVRNIPKTTHYRFFHPKASEVVSSHACDIVFTVVRNPWARAVSLYTYYKQRIETGKITTDFKCDSFNRFVEMMSRPPTDFFYRIGGADVDTSKYWFGLSTPQIDWIDVPMTYVFKTETLDEDFKQIQDLTNCYRPLNVVRKSNSTSYQDYYNTYTQSTIHKMFERDIDHFKYTFS